LSQSLLIF